MPISGTIRTTWDFPDGSEAIEVDYTIYRGAPAEGSSYACAGEPGEPDSVEIEAVRFVENGKRGPRVPQEIEDAVACSEHIQEYCRLNSGSVV